MIYNLIYFVEDFKFDNLNYMTYFFFPRLFTGALVLPWFPSYSGRDPGAEPKEATIMEEQGKEARVPVPNVKPSSLRWRILRQALLRSRGTRSGTLSLFSAV